MTFYSPRYQVFDCLYLILIASYPLKLTAERNIRLAGSLSAQSHHIDSVKCSGTESHFDQCSYSFIKAESCTLNYQAGVICTGKHIIMA